MLAVVFQPTRTLRAGGHGAAEQSVRDKVPAALLNKVSLNTLDAALSLAQRLGYPIRIRKAAALAGEIKRGSNSCHTRLLHIYASMSTDRSSEPF
eukprot:8547874-Pyramimonas_sp.AAC.1